MKILNLCFGASLIKRTGLRLSMMVMVLFLMIPGYAQLDKPGYSGSVSAGLLSGSREDRLFINALNGITVSDWFFGVGIGLDLYGMKSVPLFAGVRFYPGADKHFFAYGNLGYNFGLKKEDVPMWMESAKATGGIYSSAGIGYQVPVSQRLSVIMDLGYSFKRMSLTEHYTICPFIPPCFVQTDKYIHDYGRLKFGVGIGF